MPWNRKRHTADHFVHPIWPPISTFGEDQVEIFGEFGNPIEQFPSSHHLARSCPAFQFHHCWLTNSQPANWDRLATEKLAWISNRRINSMLDLVGDQSTLYQVARSDRFPQVHLRTEKHNKPLTYLRPYNSSEETILFWMHGKCQIHIKSWKNWSLWKNWYFVVVNL